MGLYKYKAFISYSHKDRRWARWLHRKLESYSFPQEIVASHPRVPPNLKPIFRDREELSAGHDLGEEIEAALQNSENLIVVCSPNSAVSHWVGQEILYFKRHNRRANIFAVIVDGEPFAKAPDLECFPKALRYELDNKGQFTSNLVEPLASDLRKMGDGKRLGLLKLISGVVNLGLDDVVQRDLHRARRRVTAITVSSVIIVLMMGGLTWTAWDAQKDAEKRRNDAEGQIEFMLTDLKEELEEIGRLDVLKSVGNRAVEYYDSYSVSDHDDDALGRRARVFHSLGEVQHAQGNLSEANQYFNKAYNATKELLKRNPLNASRIFDHAQSAHWAGYEPFERRDYIQAKPFFEEYLITAKRLQHNFPKHKKGNEEVANARTNYAILLLSMGKKKASHDLLLEEVEEYQSLLNQGVIEDTLAAQESLAQIYAWLSESSLSHSEAIDFRKDQIAIYDHLMRKNKKNAFVKMDFFFASYATARLYYEANDFDNAIKTINEIHKPLKKFWEKDETDTRRLKAFVRLSLLDMKIEKRIHKSARNLDAKLLELEKMKVKILELFHEDDVFLEELNSALNYLKT